MAIFQWLLVMCYSSRDNYTDFKMNTSLTWSMGDMFASATLQHFGEAKKLQTMLQL